MDIALSFLTLTVILAGHAPIAGATDCFTCTGVSAACECKTTTTCSKSNEVCFTERYQSSSGWLYNLGCRDATTCPHGSSSAHLVGRSLVGDCSQCCQGSNCNRELCQGTDPFCTDSAAFNCSLVGSTINYCFNADAANLNCKRFCGLCGLRDGGWEDWGSWSSCDKSCGDGVLTRTRECTNPSPRECGKPCPNPKSETKPCSIKACPVNGQWSGWSQWGACSVTCDIGIQHRSRACSNPAPSGGGLTCPGEHRDEQVCVKSGCVDGAWSTWSSWSACSTSCGGGLKSRSRSCDNPKPSVVGRYCVGDSSQSHMCATTQCPSTSVDGHWSAWSAWTQCSTSCGSGMKFRTRKCSNPASSGSGQTCPGTTSENQPCSSGLCPVDGVLTDWTAWGACSITCGTGGTSARHRTCVFDRHAPHGKACIGVTNEVKQCDTNITCPGTAVDGHWSSWSAWSQCSASCNIGTQSRARACSYPAHSVRGAPCSGKSTEKRFCKIALCAVDGIWSAWQPWQACSATCGTGTRQRTRTCTFIPNSAPKGQPCVGSDRDTEQCHARDCPVDGAWLEWGLWSHCTVSCGGGTKHRSRSCYFPPHVPQGEFCAGRSAEKSNCSTMACTSVDGHWSAWHAWTLCSASCGGGNKYRKRKCDNPAPSGGGRMCPGSASEIQACSSGLCPVDGIWNDWTAWGACSITCGKGGTRTRHRTCAYDDHYPHGDPCVGIATSNKTCDTTITCPADGFWETWGRWHRCSVTCGDGTRRRSRLCVYPPHAVQGKYCEGSSIGTEDCNTMSCP